MTEEGAMCRGFGILSHNDINMFSARESVAPYSVVRGSSILKG